MSRILQQLPVRIAAASQPVPTVPALTNLEPLFRCAQKGPHLVPGKIFWWGHEPQQFLVLPSTRSPIYPPCSFVSRSFLCRLCRL